MPARVIDLVRVREVLIQHIATERTLLGAFNFFDKSVAAAITAVTGGSSLPIPKQLSITEVTRTRPSNSNEAATFSYSRRQPFSRGLPRFAPSGRLPNFSSIASKL